MRSLYAVVLGVLLMSSGTGLAAGPVFIDFETLPGGKPPQMGVPVAQSYVTWGVRFWEIELGPEQPIFHKGYESDGFFAWTRQNGGYPPGFNIVADFTVPVYTVSADVMSAKNVSVTMLAKDVDGNVIGSDESPKLPQYWKGKLSVKTNVPITRVEWWPSSQASSVGVDNLLFAGRPCGENAQLKVKCRKSGRKVKAILKKALPNIPVTFKLDRQPSRPQNTNSRGKAKHKWTDQAPSNHLVEVCDLKKTCLK